MSVFGWRLVEREDRPFRGDLLTERTVLARSVEAPTVVAVLRFEREPDVRLTVLEAEFWTPQVVPGWVGTVGSIGRWATYALPVMVACWVLVIFAVRFGTPEAQRTFLALFVGPLVALWVVAAGVFVGTQVYMRAAQGPRRERIVARRRDAAVKAAGRILGSTSR
jgi:hypothetical protein